jgi:hypothetical protein
VPKFGDDAAHDEGRHRSVAARPPCVSLGH